MTTSDDRIFRTFLEHTTEEALDLARSSDLLEITPEPGPLPQRFVIDLRCRGLVRGADRRVVEADHFAAGIRFPDHYLRGPIDAFEVVTWLGPPTVFHPNCAHGAPFVCVGRISPGTDLVSLVFQLFEIVSYQRFASHDGLNREACQWVRSQPPERFPVDRRPLRWRSIRRGPDGRDRRWIVLIDHVIHVIDDQAVTDALRASGHEARGAGRGRWDLALLNGAVHEGVAVARRGWLRLEFPIELDDRWSMLRCNTGLGAGVKLVGDVATGEPRLVGELRVEPETLTGAVEAMWDRLRTAADAVLVGDAMKETDPATEIKTTGAQPIADLCEQAGWPWHERDGGRIAVELESARFPCSAEITPRRDRTTSVGATLVAGDALPAGPCREALALLLTVVAGTTRLARAAAHEPAPGRHEVRVETVLPAGADAAATGRAIESISVMCSAVGPEAALLHADEQVASRCLDLWCATTAPQRPTARFSSRSTLFEGV